MLELVATANLTTTLGNTIFVLVSFVLLLVLIKKFAWDSIVSMMEARREKISHDLDVAESKRKEAEEIQANADSIISQAERNASDIISKAHDAGQRSQNDLVKEGREIVSRMKLDAQKEIENMKQQTIVELKSQIGDLSIELASQILKKELSPEVHQQLIEEFIEGLEG